LVSIQRVSHEIQNFQQIREIWCKTITSRIIPRLQLITNEDMLSLLFTLLAVSCFVGSALRSVLFPLQSSNRHSLATVFAAKTAETSPASTHPGTYCNVELNAGYIEAAGFDMDFTLAQVLFVSTVPSLRQCLIHSTHAVQT
jgi:hypothetical protein